MPGPPTSLISKSVQIGIITLVATAVAIGGFEAGRETVHAAAVLRSEATVASQPSAEPVSQKKSLLERGKSQIIIRDIATVPFSELYDVLKSAPREQLLAWARDLEQMPRGPRQRAAVTAYYKSLIQVDHHVALEALSQSTNLPMRDVGEDALLKAAPESIWAEIAEALAQMPYPGRGWAREDVILNWSRVDPVAASKFIERHPFSAEQKRPNGEDARVFSLLSNWGEIDPSAAKTWLEADASRQTKDAFRAFLTSWGRGDPAAAIDYAVANAALPNFAGAINELVYQFVRSAKEDATRSILLLPPEQAKAALKNVADITNPGVIDHNLDRPPDYQRPPEEVARWMVTLPVDFWEESIGTVAQRWLYEDDVSASAWIEQLRPDMRDVTIVSCCRAAMSGHQSADEVIKLGLTISDHSVRDAVLGELVRSLQTTTPGAMSASERISELSISEEQKAYLRKFIRRNADGR